MYKKDNMMVDVDEDNMMVEGRVVVYGWWSDAVL